MIFYKLVLTLKNNYKEYSNNFLILEKLEKQLNDKIKIYSGQEKHKKSGPRVQPKPAFDFFILKWWNLVNQVRIEIEKYEDYINVVKFS